MVPFDILWDMIKQCWKCIYESNAYIREVEMNIVSLSRGKRELESIYNCVRGRVEDAKEAHGYVPRDPVLGWLKRAEETISKVDSLLQRCEKENAKQCLGCYCSKNYWSGENISKEVVEEIQTVRDLIGRGNFEVVADPPPPPVVENLPTETTVGLESRLRDVWSYIEDDRVRIIGMYGIKGVGKTTLLNTLHKKFNDTHNFDRVIYVKASTELNIAEIQKVIRYRLEIPEDTSWDKKDERGRAAEITGRLSKKKFALLLDDLRGEIKLSGAGVPVQDGSKIVFTTINEDVCGMMGAERRFKVDYLPPEAARNLFRLKVADDVLKSHRDIPKLANIVADMCGGLPLALTTIGSSPMFRSREPGTWQHAIDVLQSFPSKFPGMKNRIFPRLRFSYDSLSNETHKKCFLFCSLFPRNKNITEDELIELWIGEGILSDFYDNTAAARRQGKYIIESLKLACLLEEVKGGNLIRMHEMLREMALWIADKTILVLGKDDRLIKEQEISNWNDAVRVSRWGSPIESSSPTSPSSCCPGLLTLLLRGTEIKEISDNFFQFMQALKVLDYSHSGSLTKFPVRNGELTNLRYLNLSYTSISELPMEMKGFTQLRILLLDGTDQLKAIPEGLLSNLSSLQIFSWQPNIDRFSSLPIADQMSYRSFPGATVQLLVELESLKHLQEISIVLSTLDCIDVFKSSSKLQSCIRRLFIGSPEFYSLDLFSTRVQENDGCFQNLQDLCIFGCPVKDLTSLIHVPSLKSLWVENCHYLEEIIACDDVDENEMFFNLKVISFHDMPILKSICRKAVAFPSLERINVHGCPSLRKLPECANKIKVMGDTEMLAKTYAEYGWSTYYGPTNYVFDSNFTSTSFPPPMYYVVSGEEDPNACSIM